MKVDLEEVFITPYFCVFMEERMLSEAFLWEILYKLQAQRDFDAAPQTVMAPSSKNADEATQGTRQVWRPIVLTIIILAAAASYLSYPSPADQIPSTHLAPPRVTCNPNDPVKSVAIIGAGSAGSSAAYYIRRFTQGCSRINLTVYERNPYIGGRSITVNAYGDPSEPVELGASIFVKVNHNLFSAVERFGLSTRDKKGRDEQGNELPDTLGVYDGEDWVFRAGDDITGGWWLTAKLLWQYGMAPIRTRNLMKRTVGKFLKMYEAPIFPFRDLSQAVYDVGLTDTTALTGEQLLRRNSIGEAFGTNIIQASTRVNYAQNLDTIHGVETMVCMATDGAMSVDGGNWQIFSNMLAASGAQILLNTSVTNVAKQDDGRYVVSAKSTHYQSGANDGDTSFTDDSASLNPEPTTYDTIIMATPLQFASLTLTPPPVNPIPEIPYITLHVTLFTSSRTLDPQAFNLPWTSSVPSTILTTTPKGGTAPKLPFYSISTLRILTNPRTGGKEYLYKIFSPAPVDPGWLTRILLPPLSSSYPRNGTYDPRDVSWMYEKVWQSYPVESPRVTFEDVQLDEDGRVWYTSGIEGFISTMETSSLMAMNVGRLIVDGWMSDDRERVEGEPSKGEYTVQSEL
ncbi:MAG: hypothetical protein Q9163_002848 [Psora crenata]